MSDAEANEELELPSEEQGSTGSVRFGPLIISAKLSVVLIFLFVIGLNLLLLLGVILAAMHRAGRL